MPGQGMLKFRFDRRINLVVLHDLSLRLFAAHFFIVCRNDEKIYFLDQRNWIVDCSVNSRKYKNIFKNMFSAHIIYFSSRVFEDSTRTDSFAVRHLWLVDVIFGFEITSACRLWLKNVSCLKLPNTWKGRECSWRVKQSDYRSSD